MKFAFYYWLFEPLRGGLRDNPERTPAFSVPVVFEDVTYELALLIDSEGAPEAARVRIPGLTEERLPDTILPLLQVVKEHLLSTLRLVYREDIHLFPMTFWMFFDDGAVHNVDVRIEFNPPSVLDSEQAKNFFLQSFPYRNEIRLLVDGNDPRVPVQYRYLSFYKLLEHEFKTKGQWQNEKLNAFLVAYEDRLSALGYRGTLAKPLHALRDKCAHVRTGRSKEIWLFVKSCG